MKKLLILLGFLTFYCSIFGQYTGNKLPSGLTVSSTVDSADYTIIQKNGETIVKAVRMDTLKSFFSTGIIESIESLDSVSGSIGQFIISDGSGWLTPVSAKYEGNGAYTFGYRDGTVGWGSIVIGGGATGRNTATYPLAMAIGYNSDATEEFAIAMGRNATASGLYSFAAQYGIASGTKSVSFGGTSSGTSSVSFAGGEAQGRKSFAFDAEVTHNNAYSFGGFGYADATFSTWFGMANSFACISLGQYNDTIAASKTSWVATDPLLYIGNGANGASKSNALVMLKNGNTTATGNWTIDGNITADTITGYVQTMSSFGELYVADGSTPQSITNGTTYIKMTGFVNRGSYENMTVDSTNDKITITETGYYLVNITMSSICGTNGVVSRTAAFLGGVEQDNIHYIQTISNTASPNPGSCSGIIKVTTVPVDLDVRRRHDNGSPVNFTLVYGNLTCHKIAEL